MIDPDAINGSQRFVVSSQPRRMTATSNMQRSKSGHRAPGAIYACRRLRL